MLCWLLLIPSGDPSYQILHSMHESRLARLLEPLPRLRILVVGDFFLDRYLIIDPALAERSIETGLEAHQVVDVIAQPGAAGTVAANLRALGTQVTALGVVGDDGEGYELRAALRTIGVDDTHLVPTPGRRTPTYTKPLVRRAARLPRELERLDIRTRMPTPPEVEQALITRLNDLALQADAVIIADQMPESDHGAITANVRTALAHLAARLPQVCFLADSRTRIGLFARVILKPNAHEAVRAVHPAWDAPITRTDAEQAGTILMQRTGRPVFVTLSEQGMLVINAEGITHVPAVQVDGPIDIVGAGDSAMAAIAAGLCSGATDAEAALLGNLAAAVTIQQIGTTGTATPEQILAQWRVQGADRLS